MVVGENQEASGTDHFYTEGFVTSRKSTPKETFEEQLIAIPVAERQRNGTHD